MLETIRLGYAIRYRHTLAEPMKLDAGSPRRRTSSRRAKTALGAVIGPEVD